jgi:hypothetical protein
LSRDPAARDVVTGLPGNAAHDRELGAAHDDAAAARERGGRPTSEHLWVATHAPSKRDALSPAVGGAADARAACAAFGFCAAPPPVVALTTACARADAGAMTASASVATI